MNQRTEAMPKVCIASHLFFPTYGGSQTRYLRYLPGLREQGIDIRIFTGTPTEDDFTPEEAINRWKAFPVGAMLPEELVNGTPVHRIRLPDTKSSYRRFIYNRRLMRFCKDPSFRPDLVEFLGGIKPEGIALLWRLRRMGIPTLYSVTNMPKEKFSKKWLGLQQGRYRLMYNSFDCMIANNIPIRDALRGMGVSTRIEVIPNGVDLNRFSPGENDPKAAAVRSHLGIGAGELLITTVGAVMPRKGSDVLLQAWSILSRQYPGAHLALVGPRYDLEQPELSEFAAKLHRSVLDSCAPQNIHFTGLVDNVEDYVRASDIFVLPSEREGMPNSVMEAMACRVPVVITPFAGLSRDLGKADEQYLLSPRDPEALAATIGRLMRDADLRQTVATQGWEWVKANLDLETALRRYAALYRDLASSGSSG